MVRVEALVCSYLLVFALFVTYPGSLARPGGTGSFLHAPSHPIGQTHVPMRVGEPLQGHLPLYPVYVDNRIAIPAGSLLCGSVVQLKAGSKPPHPLAALGRFHSVSYPGRTI